MQDESRVTINLNNYYQPQGVNWLDRIKLIYIYQKMIITILTQCIYWESWMVSFWLPLVVPKRCRSLRSMQSMLHISTFSRYSSSISAYSHLRPEPYNNKNFQCGTAKSNKIQLIIFPKYFLYKTKQLGNIQIASIIFMNKLYHIWYSNYYSNYWKYVFRTFFQLIGMNKCSCLLNVF